MLTTSKSTRTFEDQKITGKFTEGQIFRDKGRFDEVALNLLYNAIYEEQRYYS